MKPISSALFAAALLAAVSLSLNAQSQPAATNPAELRIVGQTEPVAKVEVPPGIKGILDTVDVKEGQLVKKGDQLARLDDAVQRQTVELARQAAEDATEIHGAENQVEFAKNEYNRIKGLAPGATSTTELKQKELAVKQSELGLELKKSEQRQNVLKLAREQLILDRMTIRSPLDGIVLRINKHPGEQTDENPLVVVVQITRLNAVFFPKKELFGKIHVGDKVTLDFATEPPTRREAVVVAVDPIIEQGLFRVKFEVDNADAKIPAGTPATWTWSPK